MRNAVWGSWPHVGEAWRIRNRGGPSWFSTNGADWHDSRGQKVMVTDGVRFHRNGELTAVSAPKRGAADDRKT